MVVTGRYRSKVHGGGSTGYSFREAKKVADKSTTYPRKSRSRVVYGTRTSQFHFINSRDRDYKSGYSMDLFSFSKFRNSKAAKKALTGNRLIV